MDFYMDKSDLSTEVAPSSELLARIVTGRAILFAGAGFSTGTINEFGKEPPTARELAKEICRLGEFDEDDDLRFAADFYIDNKNKSNLVDLLKRMYTLVSVSNFHTDICSIKWRRFYTTNYDKSIEMASAKASRHVECIDLQYKTDQYYKRENLCIHLNGSIDSLSESTLEKRFKLSTSSYISPDSFLTSRWYYHFKRDLERSSAIIFVGYSMYDIEIQKVLFDNKDLKEKTYFITRENPDRKLLFTLSKFGHIVPIGVEGFANMISSNKALFNQGKFQQQLESLVEYEITNSNEDVRDSHVEALLMYGNLRQSFIDNAVTSIPRIPCLIIRTNIEKAITFCKSNKNTIIFSDFGNGKSVFLNELLPYLTINSMHVYKIADPDGDYVADVDAISKLNQKSVVVLDGYDGYLDLIQHISSVRPSNVCIIAAARTAEHERSRGTLREFDFEFNELNLDYLDDKESESFVEIIDNIGWWGAKASLSANMKKDYIIQDNNSQISLVLLELFNSPQIKDKISNIISNILANTRHKDTVFAIALLEILTLPVENSLISEVADNDDIYTSDLRDNQGFIQLFKADGGKILSKSSLFCFYLIRNYFSATYIISRLHIISKRFEPIRFDSYKEDKIFKATLRFSFVERLLPETNKKSNLLRYYEELKIHVPWLKNDPHFWLQYGMANIPFKEYGKAQGFFDQAYALAAMKYNYYVTNINTQQARLYILKAIETTDHSDCFALFENGHKMLSKLPNDVYKFRQVDNYKAFYDACFERISKGNKVSFEHACGHIIEDIEKAEAAGDINPTEQKTIAKSKTSLKLVLDTIRRR